jgi:four helix bundle protein
MKVYQTELRNKNRGYMKLIVWQKAMELFELVWKICYVEAQIDFKLRAQVADAAQSISANIAEGYGRRSVKEYLQFLYITLGSAGETMTRTLGLNLVHQISDERLHEFDVLHYEVENRLLRLIEKLEQKRDDENWIARISEDPSEDSPDPVTPSLHHSTAPSLHSTAPSLLHSITPSPRLADA